MMLATHQPSVRKLSMAANASKTEDTLKTKLTKLVMLCGLTLAAFGQAVNVTDNSPAGSPVSITGTLTFGSSGSVSCSIMGHNNSATPLLTATTLLELLAANGSTYSYQAFFRHDHFFKDVLAAPNSDFEISSDCNIWDSATITQYTSTTTPRVRVTSPTPLPGNSFRW